MDYDRLKTTYWRAQVERIQKDLGAINARDQAAAPGRVVPGEGDLVFGTGRRITGAVFFLDISAFSARHAEYDAEQESLLRVLTLFFSEMIKIAEEYGGTVEKNTGDGLMAYFEDGGGDPPADGPKRAIAAALTMLYVNRNGINVVLRNSSLEPLNFRIGIEYGSFTIAKIGAKRRFGSIVAIGTTANMANKMLGMAAPGEIVIGESAKLRLPMWWQLQFCSRLERPSGWVYRQSGKPYPFYRYEGRWTGPQ